MALRRAGMTNGTLTEGALLNLQRQFGNQYVGQVVRRAAAREEQPNADLDGVRHAIDAARGGGSGLDSPVRDQMQSSFGADFSGVRVHTDTHADSLSRALDARAFTTGKDIFFRRGEYNPGSSDGRALLAHELTHVVQQNGDAIARQMSVSHPDDPEEVEAEQVSKAVTQRESAPAGTSDAAEERKKEADVGDPGLQRQPEALSIDDEKEKQKQGASPL
jgi:hypothetical protein